ncbi:hypothetical protein CRE_31146 [Caenorhabditis remanei]|uniref:DUF4139 domain-containing protein n=1 Tax=Caenorhabditis remanei TaxID=31234 RepID=E3LTE2_CAERE|nr:hypothetical protein CRE_31146 [Caenorhabditis remanei]
MATIHEFDIRVQEISNVTILSDRAEVKKVVPVSVKAGINEVQLKNFSPCLERDSVRVDGHGKATICDVSVKESVHTDTTKVVDLRKELEKYVEIRKMHEDQRDILKKTIEGLDRTIGEIGRRVMNPSKESGSVVIDEQLLNGLQKLFDFHQAEAEALKLKFREKEQEIAKTNEMTTKINEELLNLQVARVTISHCVIITLEAFEDGEVELEVIYQVFQTGWQPSYDIRVDTQTPSMTITYYGKLHNHSGEDWNELPAVLSTAQPCLGGHIPELGTLDAQFYRPVYLSRPRGRGSMKKSMMMRRAVPEARGMENHDDYMEEENEEMETMSPPEMEVTQNTLSTEFKIPRKSNLPTGTSDHKVTIGTIVLTPSLVHESVPSKNAAAFLTASALNTSVFPFLEGETSIFLDNAFVAKSYMKNVSPGERFTCSLGVDTAIRVEYKPAKKFHEEGGYITKHSALVTEQTVTVKNTRSGQPLLLTVKHHVPRSTEEKIRVKLASPVAIPYDPATANENEVLEPKEGIKMNKDHNLEWTVKLPPTSSKDLVIKWIVEHAKGQNIILQEKL